MSKRTLAEAGVCPFPPGSVYAERRILPTGVACLKRERPTKPSGDIPCAGAKMCARLALSKGSIRSGEMDCRRCSNYVTAEVVRK